MKVEVRTMFDGCANGCKGFNIYNDGNEYRCARQCLCEYGAKAMLKELQERFEDREHEAYKNPNGLKEHAVWNRAIRILEEYIDESD